MPFTVDGMKARSAMTSDTRTLPLPSNRRDATQTRDAQSAIEATPVEIQESKYLAPKALTIERKSANTLLQKGLPSKWVSTQIPENGGESPRNTPSAPSARSAQSSDPELDKSG
eukprot:843124-Pleurochrysis_carterae.AAC.2